MDERLLGILDYYGEGYKALVDYGGWRVAMLHYADELHPNRLDSMERHTETDEVFVLIHGLGVLLIGGNNVQVNGISSQVMDFGKIYNVKCNVWHTILLSRDASVLLVENSNTSEHNSEYTSLTNKQRHSIMEIAKQMVVPDTRETQHQNLS
jgi:ureidoglycolate hydrolase